MIGSRPKKLRFYSYYEPPRPVYGHSQWLLITARTASAMTPAMRKPAWAGTARYCGSVGWTQLMKTTPFIDSRPAPVRKTP